MKELLQKVIQAERKKILMLGDIMLDEYLFGVVDRLSREAPVPIVKEEKRELVCGGAANLVRNLQRGGCSVDVIGLIGGADSAGKQLLELFKQHTIPTEGIVCSATRKTTCKQRIVVQNQQLLRVDIQDEAPLTDADCSLLMQRFDLFHDSNTLVLLSDYGSNILDATLIAYVVKRAHELGNIVISDPRGPDFEKYYGVDYLKPNHKEFDAMVDYFGLPRTASLIENGLMICQTLGLKGLIVTLGGDGIQYISPSEILFSPGFKREVFDVSGAGDTVLAYVAIGLLAQLPLRDALKLANYAASIAVSHHKTYAVGIDDLIEDQHIESKEKVVHSWQHLKEKLDYERKKGKRIVFTNGCFDLLHSGHLFVLEEAKKCGDLLLVALNSDESITRLKGIQRPIRPLFERARLMAALGVVDYVGVFGEDTASAFIEYLKPDVVVKGGDYQAEKLPEYPMISSYGGTVVIVNYQKGLSTTNIVSKITLAHRADNGLTF